MAEFKEQSFPTYECVTFAPPHSYVSIVEYVRPIAIPNTIHIIEGSTSFRPNSQANPFTGQKNRINLTHENKIIFQRYSPLEPKSIAAISKIHPYQTFTIEQSLLSDPIDRADFYRFSMQLTDAQQLLDVPVQLDILGIGQMGDYGYCFYFNIGPGTLINSGRKITLETIISQEKVDILKNHFHQLYQLIPLISNPVIDNSKTSLTT